MLSIMNIPILSKYTSKKIKKTNEIVIQLIKIMEFQLTFKIIIIVVVLIAVYATLRNLDVIKIILIYLKDLLLRK